MATYVLRPNPPFLHALARYPACAFRVSSNNVL